MRTTKRQFEDFKNECLRLQKTLNLKDWKIYFNWAEGSGYYSKISSDVEGNVATISICKSYKKNHFWDVKISAKHEMIHLFLARLENLAKSRYVSEEQIYSEEERLARVLEKLNF